MALHWATYRGDDKDFAVTLTQAGLPVDLTTAAIVFSGRVAADFAVDEAPVISLSAPGDIVLAASQSTTGKGKATLTIPAATSVDLEPGLYLCDFEVTLAGNVWTWPEPVYGQSTLIRLRVKADVTHP